MSKVYSIKQVQKIPMSLDVAWDFFSKPSNLQKITPANMHFNIVSEHHGDEMHAGQIIEYRFKLFLGIKMYWMTEITHVEPKKYFVDEQRYGPYSMWHHQHRFREIEGGVEMTDVVYYKIPFWFLGDIANRLFVRKQLEKIFEFRDQRVIELFGRF